MAEVIAMISSLSKIPVDQSIAVTGSLNQFGQVQPIGGVNEKIEGFFNVCKKIGTYIGKAVLIPESNKDELILNSEIEEAVRKGEFKIYLMKDINEALSTLLLNDTMPLDDLILQLNLQLKHFLFSQNLTTYNHSYRVTPPTQLLFHILTYFNYLCQIILK